MKKMKRSVLIWAITGAILSLCTLAVAICGINSSPVVAMDSTIVTEVAEQTLACARSGDYEKLGQMLYGTPDLGVCPEKTETAESMIWYAYLDSITYQVAEECYPSETGVALDVHISCMDISAVTDSLRESVPDLLLRLAKDAENKEDIFDEQKNYREAFISEVLSSAAAQALAEQPQTIERELTLNLVRANGRWQVVPTEPLLQFLSGFVSE